MAVYLGNIGNIELTRKSLGVSKESLVNPDDVNAVRRRFSFDFDEGFLISGDLVEITSIDGTNLDFIDSSGWSYGEVEDSGAWFVFIDDLGGIRLYRTFDDSLEGTRELAVPLADITRDIPISVTVKDRGGRLLACVTDYELNTSREAIDITTLSDEYRQQYSGLITGSGRLTAQWDYGNIGDVEPVNYLMQLVLRTEIGSVFGAKFYIKSEDTSPAAGAFDVTQINDALWWEFDAVITNSATSFSPGDIIVSTVDFVTTGPVRLKARTAPQRRLLQESGDPLLLEQGGYLLLETQE
jgi:hypothetical protein